MPRWLHALQYRLPRATAIWMLLCVLLGLGLLTTLLDAGPTAQQETRHANLYGQRTIIDAVTGLVASSTPPQQDAPAFEVSTEEPEPKTDAPATEAAAPAETPAAPDAATPTPEPEAPKKITIDGPALRTDAVTTPLPTLPVSREATVTPPAPEITEQADGLLLPVRGKTEGTTPASLYAKRFQREEDPAYIAFLLTDLGFNNSVLASVLELPKEVTLAFSPYALEPQPQIVLAHNAGFESWGMLPTQTSRYPQDDPGPLGIIGGQMENEQQSRLKQVLASTLGSVGMVLPPDEALSTQKDFVRVLNALEQRGLLLLSTHPQRSVTTLSADAEMQKIIRRADLVLDSTDSAAFVQSKLAGLDALAKTQKKLIVVASARPHIVATLAAWFKKHPYQGEVRLASLSAMYAPDPPLPPPVEEAKPAKKGGH